jgi:hypothetical protein
LKHLLDSVEVATIDDLLAAYNHAIELRFELASQVLLAILVKLRTNSSSKQLLILLDKIGNTGDDVGNSLETVRKRLDRKAAKQQGQSETRTIAEVLETLYDSLDGADFRIKIKGGSARFKCHAFIVASRWSYFRQKVTAESKEARECKLVLPALGSSSSKSKTEGMHPAALRAILDMVYLNRLREDTKKELAPLIAKALLSTYDVYLMPSPTGAGIVEDAVQNSLTHFFDPLIEFAKEKMDQIIDYDNCVANFMAAMELGMLDDAKAAMKVLARNLKQLARDPVHQKQLKAICEDNPEVWKLYIDELASS